MIAYLFVIFAFCIDLVISTWFTPLFVPTSMYFVSNVAFCAMIISIRKMNLLDSYLLCMFCGIVYDTLFAQTFLLYFVIYSIICFIAKIWMRHVNNSVIENILLCISTLFIKELIVYSYMLITSHTIMSISTWLTNRMSLTLLVNALLVSLIVFLSYVKDDYMKQREVKLRKEERLPWMH